MFLSVMSLESIFTLTNKMFRHLSLFNTNIKVSKVKKKKLGKNEIKKERKNH